MTIVEPDEDPRPDSDPDAPENGDVVRFRWADGGTGTMTIVWTGTGLVQDLTIAFDQGIDAASW